MSKGFYSEEAVLAMLKEAYASGFYWPMELADECCRTILANGTKESDLDLLNQMQEREKSKTDNNCIKYYC